MKPDYLIVVFPLFPYGNITIPKDKLEYKSMLLQGNNNKMNNQSAFHDKIKKKHGLWQCSQCSHGNKILSPKILTVWEWYFVLQKTYSEREQVHQVSQFLHYWGYGWEIEG